MALTAYCGVMGSGKTYEVVENVILANLAIGRRIVTNIAGLDSEKINAYLVNVRSVPFASLGQIVPVANEDVSKFDFFPREGLKDQTSIVQPGDIVILDECWRWYATGEKLLDSHMLFFRMHRHFVNSSSGVACDVVLIVQSIDDLQRKVKAVIEKTYLMKKHKDLGMPDRYVVSIYTGSRPSSRSFVEDFQRKYNPEIYALYASYSQQQGAAVSKELAADSRGNVLNRGLIKYGFPLAAILLVASVWYMWRFFHPSKEALTHTEASLESSPNALPLDDKSQSSLAPLAPASNLSTEWRLIGYFSRSGFTVYMISSNAGLLRFITDPPGVFISSGEIQLLLPDGFFVTRWTGSPPSAAARPFP